MRTQLGITVSDSREEQDALLLELYRHMFMVAYSIMRNKNEAMDVVQESWLKILMKIDTLKDQDKLIQWAKAIAANTAFNLVRHKLKQARARMEEDADREPLSAERVEDFVVQKILCEQIGKLDEKTRQIFIYKFYEDMKDKEIAERMQLPVGTVKARLHRGKEQLRSMLMEPFVRGPSHS